MRALPPLSLTVTRHRNWNAAVVVLAAVALAALAGWAWTWRDSLQPLHGIGLAFGVLAVAAAASGVWQRGGVQLAWDGSLWWLGDLPGRPNPLDRPHRRDAEPCECRVALDLGGFLLLRCRARRTRWLALQRDGLAADWHALRCAVYASRP